MDYYKKFLDYCNKYPYKECKYKIDHSVRVSSFALKIADDLNYDDDLKDTVYLSSLLHDIGRFEQFHRYKTFVDSKSKYHGDIGVEVLINDNLIDKFTDDSFKKKSCLLTCKYHGTLDKLEDNKYYNIVKIVRDSDKIDILNNALLGNIELDIGDDFISSKAIESFNKHELLNLKNKKTKADRFVVWVCFIFDFNYKYTYKYLKESKLMDKLILKYINKTNNVNCKRELKRMGKEVNKYIEEMISC